MGSASKHFYFTKNKNEWVFRVAVVKIGGVLINKIWCYHLVPLPSFPHLITWLFSKICGQDPFGIKKGDLHKYSRTQHHQWVTLECVWLFLLSLLHVTVVAFWSDHRLDSTWKKERSTHNIVNLQNTFWKKLMIGFMTMAFDTNLSGGWRARCDKTFLCIG